MGDSVLFVVCPAPSRLVSWQTNSPYLSGGRRFLRSLSVIPPRVDRLSTGAGMFGISDFYGIINPNNAAILSVGATIKKPVVNERDEIVVGQMMKVGLSGDHRTIDGAVGAQYLQALKEILETPALMLV